MTSLPLPLPPDDPRQVRALEAASEVVMREQRHEDCPVCREEAHHTLAAYFSALQTEGVVLVERNGELDSLCCELARLLGPGKAPKGVTRAAYWISRVAQALGEAETSACEEAACANCGAVQGEPCGAAVDNDCNCWPEPAAPPCKACEGTGEANAFRDDPSYGLVPCPRCKGSGRARMVALDDVVEWLRGERKLPSEAAAIQRERRFSGTGEEPHG